MKFNDWCLSFGNELVMVDVFQICGFKIYTRKNLDCKDTMAGSICMYVLFIVTWLMYELE